MRGRARDRADHGRGPSSVGLTSANTLLTGLQRGLDVSADTGCNWAYAGGALADQSVFDVVVRRDDPHTALVGISTFIADDGGSEAGASYDNRLFQSTDDGADWTPLGVPFDPSLLVTTFDVAPSDPSRLYAAGVNESTSPRSFWMNVSTNAGAAWSEVPLPLDPTTEQQPFVAAVDPTNADRVYVRSQGSPSRLFVSEDAGQTFQVAFSLVNAITGFALSPDGSTVYAGSMKDGLFAAPAGGAFQKVSGIQVGCLAARAGELWACSDEASGFVLGVSTDGGGTFTPKLHFADVAGPLACGADATAAICGVNGSAFSNLCTVLNECFATGPLVPESEGGAPAPMSALCRSGANCPCANLDNCLPADAGSGEGGGAAMPGRHDAGCSTAGSGSAVGLFAGGVLVLVAARRRRPSPRRRRSS